MALSAELGKVNLKPESISTTATITLDMLPTGPTITSSHLETTVKIPGADKAVFEKATSDAKAGCPISRLLNTKITMEAKLEG